MSGLMSAAGVRARGFSVVRRFVDDVSGAITMLILPMFLLMIFATGLAIDLVRFEAHRADLQNALDRGVLAAASLNQTQPVEQVVEQYVATRTFKASEVALVVDPDISLNSREVTADASYVFNTAFLNIAGLPEIDLGAGAMALEGTGTIEVSLVLDISGSMAREPTSGTTDYRLDVLRDAASEFVETLLTQGGEETTTISLVPYAGQVNAGPLFDHMLDGPRVHTHSSCVEFSDLDFNNMDLPAEDSMEQTPHFQWFSFERLRGQSGFPFDPNAGHEAEWGWCPNDAQAIVPFSNDPENLKTRIAGFVGHDGTGTQIGMKWGLALLSPQTRPLIQQLALDGDVAEEFANSPGDFVEGGPQKIIVLMTDGRIRYQVRPKPSYYDTQSDIDFWAFNEDQLACCSGGKLYAKNKLSRYTSYSTLSSSSARNADELNRRQQFLTLCNQARLAGVRVYTIGFDIEPTSAAYDDMSACATTTADFFDVDGLELFDAFSQISADVQRLKLVMR